MNGFELFMPDPLLAKDEKPGNMNAIGQGLPFIQAEGGLPYVDLPAKLVELIKHCWTMGQVNAQAPVRQTFATTPIGSGARTNHIPNMVSSMQATRTPQGIIDARKVQERNVPYAKEVHPLIAGAQGLSPHLANTVPTDWKVTEELHRVNAYTFRGDSRGPKAIEAAGGFNPPITRTDQYYVDEIIFPKFEDYMRRRFNLTVSKEEFARAYKKTVVFEHDRMVVKNFFAWKSMVENEAFHLGRMLNSETLKGYISTTKSIGVAKGFARAKGWVYLTLVRGGYHVPDKKCHVWTEAFGEQEIALPGPIPWDHIFAFRKLQEISARFTGPLYVRKGFAARNPTAYAEAVRLMSGGTQ